MPSTSNEEILYKKKWLSFVKFGTRIEHHKTDLLMCTCRITEPERTVILSDFEPGIPSDPT